MAMTSNSLTPPRRLLDLPPEIRNLIWELCVVHKDEVLVMEGTVSTLPKSLRLDRRTWAEAISIQYGSNIFLVANSERWCIRFLKSLTPEARASLRTVRLLTRYRGEAGRAQRGATR